MLGLPKRNVSLRRRTILPCLSRKVWRDPFEAGVAWQNGMIKDDRSTFTVPYTAKKLTFDFCLCKFSQFLLSNRRSSS